MSINPCGSANRSLYEAFSLPFLTKLDRASHPVIRDLISKGPGSQIAYQTVEQKVQQCKLEGFKERQALMALQEFEMQGKVGRRQEGRIVVL